MKNDYHDQAMRALQLAGMSERTQESYTRFVRQLVEFCGKTPEKITEQELQDYFLHRKNKDKWAAATLRISYSGIKFFFTKVRYYGFLHPVYHITRPVQFLWRR